MNKIFFFVIIIACSLFASCISSTAEMVTIPAGFFSLGSTTNPDENPERTIFLSDFQIDVFEVTVEEYKECVDDGICNYPLEGQNFVWDDKKQEDNVAINGVSWFDAIKYCTYLKKRLPTEAEWEKAASWNKDRKYTYSNKEIEQSCTKSNYNGLRADCANKVKPVGSYVQEINETFDINGNLWEWVNDWYHPNTYSQILARDPRGPNEGLLKVNRGGSYLSRIKYVTTSFRGANNPVLRSIEIGFRCAVSAPQK